MESLYSDPEIQELYSNKKKNRNDLLQAIALVMLTYTVVNDAMSLSEKEYKKEYTLLTGLIVKLIRANIKAETSIINNVLEKTAKKVFEEYSYNAGLKEIKKIIEANFKGKHFSDRVWDNEQETAKRLKKQINEFLKGKINVNEIKKDIEKTFNTSAYNSRRLVETEISRVANDSFRRFCEETGVKKVKRNAILDGNTCNDCAELDGKIYDLKDMPQVSHPLCRCFFEIVN